MTDPLPDLERVTRSGGPGRPRTRLWIALAVSAVAVLVVVAAVTGAGPFSTQRQPAAVVSSPAGSASATDGPGPSGPSDAAVPPGSSEPSVSPATPSAGTPLIAAVDDSGVLSTVDASGGSRHSYSAPGVVFGFPAWSPDGTRLAIVGVGAEDAAIYVFAVDRTGPDPGLSGDPSILYRSVDHQPFYLYWTPDGGHLSFLTDEDLGLALRIAPADGIQTFDGDGPSSVLQRGQPLYFDWISGDRALVHTASGTDSFIGEVGLDGNVVAGSRVVGTGVFRPAVASHDGRWIAYATSGNDSIDAVVVAARDRTSSRQLPSFGPTAMLFSPTDDTLATIGAVTDGTASPLGLPVGPLRVLDPVTGGVRTLLDGPVVAFFWSPDGRTVAALEATIPSQAPVAGTDRTDVITAGAVVPRGQVGDAPQSAGIDASLVFVDIATGRTRPKQAVRLADHFVEQLLPYFDQYALSHRLWSPDSRSLVLPAVAASGQDQLEVLSADGAKSRLVTDGSKGFWSP